MFIITDSTTHDKSYEFIFEPREGEIFAVSAAKLRRSFLDAYEVHQVGGHTILEYWIPAEDLESFNANIVGPIEVVAEYR